MRNAAKIGLACLLSAACESNPPAQEAEAGPPSPTDVETAVEAAALDPAAVSPRAPSAERPPVLEGPAFADIIPDLEIPEVPQAPADYGLIKPPLPLPEPEALVVHALAGYEVVAVYAEPNPDAEKLGYLRLGARTMVTKKLGTDGCPKGWHALPSGGFACASKGLVVDAKRPPYLHRPPPPPRDEALPYDYAYVKTWNSPMWWRVPTEDELEIADQQRAIREAAREGKPPPTAAATETKPAAAATETKPAVATTETKPAVATTETKPAADAAASPVADLPKPPGSDDAEAKPAALAEAKPAAPKPAETTPPVVAAAEAPAAPEPKLPFNPENPWLEKGFFISLGEAITEGDHTWWHTARGAYVDQRHAYQYEAKDFKGVVLGEEASFPFGYAMVKKANVYELSEDGKPKVVDGYERRTFVDLTEEIEVDGVAYMMTVDGQMLRKKDLRLAEPQSIPEGIEPWERWIDVSLSKQMLVAYEGTRPVYVTLVSTGRKGTEEEPFDTPPGRYRIRSKHISTTMDGDTASDGSYSIQDVPWAMFFEGSYALHGAFWHNGFGRVRSHGCVNLGPSDAHWLFSWTTPFLPEGWHGVHAHEGSPGTTIIVRE